MNIQLVHNPVAGPRDVDDDLQKVIEFLRMRGNKVSVRKTFGPGDATTYAREAVVGGMDMVVAAGGDGTIGECAAGLVGSDCALGVLPVGTGNVWARMVDLPVWTPVHRSAMMDAAKVLLDGQRRRIDLGRMNDRHFMLWAGVGFNAQVTHDIEPHRDIRRSLGNLSYVVMTLVLTFRLRGTRVTISVDDQIIRQRVLMVLITNAQLYAQSWRVAPQARLDDGLFDVYVFKGGSTLDALCHFGLVLLGQHRNDPKIDVYRARSISIQSQTPLPLQIDGEPAGHIPATVQVMPRAVEVVVPQWVPCSLFEGGDGACVKDASLGDRITERFRSERERLREEGERIVSDIERRIHGP